MCFGVRTNLNFCFGEPSVSDGMQATELPGKGWPGTALLTGPQLTQQDPAHRPFKQEPSSKKCGVFLSRSLRKSSQEVLVIIAGESYNGLRRVCSQASKKFLAVQVRTPIPPIWCQVLFRLALLEAALVVWPAALPAVPWERLPRAVALGSRRCFWAYIPPGHFPKWVNFPVSAFHAVFAMLQEEPVAPGAGDIEGPLFFGQQGWMPVVVIQQQGREHAAHNRFKLL